MSISGVVKNGVVVPKAALPEGAEVEIRLKDGWPDVTPPSCCQPAKDAQEAPVPPARLTATELRRLPREQRQAVLAAAAELAEEDYRTDKELIGFQAFSEEVS